MQGFTTIHIMFKLFTLTMMHLQSHAPQVCTWKHLCCLTNVLSFFHFFLSLFCFGLVLTFLKDKQSLVGADCHVPKVVVTSRHCIPQFAVDDGKLQKRQYIETQNPGALHTQGNHSYIHTPAWYHKTSACVLLINWKENKTKNRNRTALPSCNLLQSNFYEETLYPVNTLVHQ